MAKYMEPAALMGDLTKTWNFDRPELIVCPQCRAENREALGKARSDKYLELEYFMHCEDCDVFWTEIFEFDTPELRRWYTTELAVLKEQEENDNNVKGK